MMAWERFIRTLPESMSVPLYNKPACVSILACGTLQINRQAIVMMHAQGAEYVELFYNKLCRRVGLEFFMTSTVDSLRLTPTLNRTARKIWCKTFMKEYGIKLPQYAVRLKPRQRGLKMIVDLPIGMIEA